MKLRITKKQTEILSWLCANEQQFYEQRKLSPYGWAPLEIRRSEIILYSDKRTANNLIKMDLIVSGASETGNTFHVALNYDKILELDHPLIQQYKDIVADNKDYYKEYTEIYGLPNGAI